MRNENSLLSIVALGLLAWNVPAQTIELDVRGITVGTTRQAVLRKLGKPLATVRGGFYPCDDGPILSMKYSGLVLKLLQHNDTREFFVAAVEVTAAKWPVAPRIGVGSRLQDVVSKFGTPEITIRNGRKTVSYLMPEGEAVFTFRRGKAVKIEWEFNVC